METSRVNTTNEGKNAAWCCQTELLMVQKTTLSLQVSCKNKKFNQITYLLHSEYLVMSYMTKLYTPASFLMSTAFFLNEVIPLRIQ